MQQTNKNSKLKAFIILTSLCAIGVLLDVVSTWAGLNAGFVEAGNALFALEFFGLSALAVGLYDIGLSFGSRFVGFAPVLFSFAPAINNFAVIGGLV